MTPALLEPRGAGAPAGAETGADAGLLADVLGGLALAPKRLPSKYFYDARGSALFEAICQQPEYYLTRTELDILREQAGDIAGALGPGVRLVEYGSGSGIKTELLLAHLERPSAYVPIDVSAEALAASAARLAARFPGLPVLPLCADFTRDPPLPPARGSASRAVVYFPGSTIGNFENPAAVALLRQMRRQVGARGGALVGIDLRKDRATLEAAYNDAAGVTAAFTLNLLVRLNRELGADFDLDAFRHRAVYDEAAGRIETDLVSLREQAVHVHGRTFRFAAGEAMRVEYSYKYSEAGFAALAAEAELRVAHVWTDPARRFGVVYLLPR